MEISSPFWWALFILIIVCKERDGSFTYVWACYCLLPQLTSLLHECIFFLPLLGAFWPGNWSFLSRYIALHWSGHRRGSRTLCGQMCNSWAQLLFNEKIKHEQNITMVWAEFFFSFTVTCNFWMQWTKSLLTFVMSFPVVYVDCYF